MNNDNLIISVVVLGALLGLITFNLMELNDTSKTKNDTIKLK